MKIKIISALTLFILTLTFVFYIFETKRPQENKEKEDHSVAYDALQFLGSAAAFPNTDVPSDAYGRAWDFYKANFSNATSRLHSNSEWQSMGPQNVGGRTISIAIDPVDTNIIWLGSASGGLWKSTTGGYGINAWQYITTGFPVLGVGAIAINPNNKNEMYIGTGETYDYGTSLNGLDIRTTRGSNGIGILKSLDGGITWTHSLNWNYNQQRGIWDIVFNPQNPKTVYAATTEGIYKSLDAGTSWTISFNKTMVMDLEIDPSDSTILYAGVGNLSSPDHGLFKSTDAGTIWNKLTTGLPGFPNSGRITIDVYKNNPNIVMANIANDFSSVGLYRSENKGLSWSIVSTSDVASYQGWYAKCLKIKDTDSNNVFVGGVYLFQSLTGGNNLLRSTDFIPEGIDTLPWPDLHGLISNPLDANKIYLLTDAGLYRSNDFGEKWNWCANGYNVSQFYHGSVVSSDSNLALGGLQDRNTHRYNGTLNWIPVDGGDGTFNAIDQTNPSIQFAASQYLYMNQSVDSGYNFFNIFMGNQPAFVAPYMIAPSNHLVMYAGDENLNFSYDQGISWNNSGSVDFYNPILSMDISHTDENKIYFATTPSTNYPMHVFLSEDGGQTYANISTGLPDRYPRDIAVDPSNDSIAYIVFSGFGTGHVYKTINNGNTWTDVSATLPDIPLHTVFVNPVNPNLIFVGCDYGVFVSYDGGTAWETLNAGLPEAVMVFDIEYSEINRSLVIFTHGHGVYKRNLDDLFVGIPTLSSSINSFQIYPTIVNQNLTAEFFSAKQSVKMISLIDQTGKIIYSQKINSTIGKNKIYINLPPIQSGIYFCKLTGDNNSSIKKIVKTN